MTVAVQVPATAAEGDGVTTAFVIGFAAPVAANLRVTVDGAARTLGVDFSVAGGQVQFVVAPAAGAAVAIERRTPIGQAKAFPNQPTMRPQSVEDGLNERALVDQEVAQRADRALLAPIGEGGLTLPAAASRSGKSARFDDAGNVIAADEPTWPTDLADAPFIGVEGGQIVPKAVPVNGSPVSVAMAAVIAAASRAGAAAVMGVPMMVTAAQFADSPALAAQAAYAANLPYLKEVDTDVMIDVGPDLAAAADADGRAAVLTNAFNWTGRAPGGGYGSVGVKMPQGLIDVGANRFLRGREQRRLYLEAAGAPSFLDVTSISSTAVVPSVTEREVTIGFATALPAYVVPDYWVGLQNPVGNNDAVAFGGSWRVRSIGGDRKSIVARRHFRVTPVDPTAMTNGGTSRGLAESKLLVPQSCLVGTWSSAAEEGMFTLLDGAVAQSKWMGMGASDTGAEGCIVQIAGGAGRWESLDYEVWGAAGDRCIRVAFGGGDFYINRGCMGADNRTTGSELIGMQGGGFSGVIRATLGGARIQQVSVGQGSGAYIAQTVMTGGSTAVLSCIGSNTVLIYPSTVGYGERGILADASRVIANSGGGSSATTLKNNLGLDSVRGGDIVGPVTSSGDVTAAWARADMMRDGGRYVTRNVNPVDGGRSVTVADDQVMQAALGGTSGEIRVTSRHNTADRFVAVVKASPSVAGFVFVREAIGADCRDTIAGGGTALTDGLTNLKALALPVNDGRKTFNVWINGATYMLQILNEDGGARTFDITLTGDLELGAFAP